MRFSRRLALATVLCAARLVHAQAFEVTWDKDLAFDYDREHYQQLLQSILTMSWNEVATATALPLQRTLKVNVYSRPHFEQQFGSQAAHTQGAHYFRGTIDVNGGSQLDLIFAGSMVHEMTHAFLDFENTGHLLPTWFNEGLAETLSWKHKGLPSLAPNQLMELKVAREKGDLTPLPAHGNLSVFGYLQSHGAVLFLEEKVGNPAVRAIARKALGGMPFEQALRSETNWTLGDFEQAYGAWIQRLE